jgi:hypothetical protein
MTEIRKGARVRVTYTGTYESDNGMSLLVKVDGSFDFVDLPGDGAVVVELPPAEPTKRGALVEVTNSAGITGMLYVRPYSDDGSDPQPWRSAAHGEAWYSWATIVDDARSVRVLFDGVDDPS